MSPAPVPVPVPVRARRDGWTPARQAAFVAALRDTRTVTAAARVVGMSWQSAYRLRARPDAGGFTAAWDAALAGPDLAGPFTGRAMGGIATPITYRGRRIGERRRYDNRLAKYLLRLRCPERFGPARERGAADRSDPAATLDAILAALHANGAAAEPPRGIDSRVDVARKSSPSAPRPPFRTSAERQPPTRPRFDSG